MEEGKEGSEGTGDRRQEEYPNLFWPLERQAVHGFCSPRGRRCQLRDGNSYAGS